MMGPPEPHTQTSCHLSSVNLEHNKVNSEVYASRCMEVRLLEEV